MCQKLPYCAREIDPCIRDEIAQFNKDHKGKYHTFSSCCGHGKYKKTFVVENVISGALFEWLSGVLIYAYSQVGYKKKQYIRIYKSDRDGHYYIPGVETILSVSDG